MGPKRNEETWLSDVKLVQKQVLTLTERVKRLASSLDSLEADYHRRHELDSDFNSDGCNPYRG